MSRLTRSEIETMFDDLILAHPIYTPQLRALREHCGHEIHSEDEAGNEVIDQAVDADLTRSLERRLSLAQTEIKGHMRVKDDLDRRIAELEKALKIIERWSEFPATGDFHEGGTPVSYGAAFGSNGERDYMRSIAKEALKSRA